MFKKKSESKRDPNSKSGVKGPKPYQGYILALIIIIILVFYSVMYW
ncbi:Uncharacterised protein [Serratia proteamaculans]|nr:Uncharacterised protein [Serratia proteamaculans]